MRFYSAVTKSPMRLNGVLTDGWHEFPAGTKLTAADAGNGKWHLNADRDGETYDGYADTAELEIGAVVAVVNEPAAEPQARLGYLRMQIEAEAISYAEIAELQSLAAHIEPGDVQLLQWAGVEEFPAPEPTVYKFTDVQVDWNGITRGGYIDVTLHNDNRPEDESTVAASIPLTLEQALKFREMLDGQIQRVITAIIETA